MKIILVTGTPGTGKTSFSLLLAKHTGYKHIDIGSFIKKHHLSSGYDRGRQVPIVDPAKVEAKIRTLFLTKALSGLILNSHFSHTMFAGEAHKCLVLTCNTAILQRRLKVRGYSKAKIRENLEAEIFRICELEAIENHQKVVVLDSSRSSAQTLVKRAIKILKI